MASFPIETLNLPPPINGQESANDHNEPQLNAGEEIQPSIPQSTGDIIAAANSAEKRKREDEATGDPQLESAEPSSSPSLSLLHPLHKTSLCSYFRKAGTCCHGSTCRFAHGDEELRIRPDNTWDPTSERAKKARKLEDGEKCGVKDEVVEEVMMTEAVVDGDDDGEDGDQDAELSKCLVHLPRKWHSDNLKKFLADHIYPETSFGLIVVLGNSQCMPSFKNKDLLRAYNSNRSEAFLFEVDEGYHFVVFVHGRCLFWQGILFKSAKKKKGMTVGFVHFESAEQLQRAVEVFICSKSL